MRELAHHPTSRPDAVTDEERLAALDSYGILDTPPEAGFDDIVHLATLACDVPVALVSLVDRDRQWFKANIGFPHCQTDLERSVCAHALETQDLLVIPDLRADPRTANNPLVVGDPHIRFYAGAPLRNGNGHVLGSLCVIDKVPRPEGLTDHQAGTLRILARQVVALVELRRSVTGRDAFIARRRTAERRMGEIHARLKLSEAHWRRLFERLTEGLVIGEVVRDDAGRATDWRYLDVNAAWGDLLGMDPDGVVGRTVREVLPGIEEEWVQDLVRVVETSEAVTFTRRLGMLDRWYEGRAFPLDGDRFAVLFLEVTDRVRGDMQRAALLEVGDQLRNLGTVEEMTSAAAGIVGRALEVTRAGFGRMEPGGEHVVVEPDWTAEGMPSIAGRHRLEDYGDIRQGLLLGEPLIICDALDDPRTAGDREHWEAARVRSLVNVPIQERGRTVALFLVHDARPREWPPATVAFLRNVADRLGAGVARLRSEAEQQLLNQELSHRMKNMLAMVQALASQTLKGVTEQEAVAGFHQRLRALGSAHDVLLQENWAAASLADVVRAVLGQSSQMDRIDVDGPAVTLGPRATLSVSLLLHELATNAVKHGALSAEEGRVVVAWHVDAAADELVLTWNETGGPPAREPDRVGFGSRLLRAGLTGTGGVALRYLPTGFEAEMRAAMERLQDA